MLLKLQGLVNIVRFFCELLRCSSADRVLGLTTFCFDISMLEIFMPLVSGAALVLVSAATQKNPYRIQETLRRHAVTVMQATPTTYEVGAHDARRTRSVCGSEVVGTAARRLRRCFSLSGGQVAPAYASS